MSPGITPRPFKIVPAPAAGDESVRSSGATIMVVDDDVDIRDSITELLEEHGYQVIAAKDGVQAADYLANKTPPDCVVLDLWMPEMDGWELAREVLQGRLPRVPMIVITAASAQFGYPIPARYVMRKPINPDRLLMLIRELVPAGGPVGALF